eukprot:GSChrysophyteH1.ASY1.ANO1.10.1 assembled CDS
MVDSVDAPELCKMGGEVDSERSLRDYKLSIEYKYLVDHAPGGVFLLPELENIRTLHGVIFVRRGLYRDGVFRFVIHLPEEYNAANAFPDVRFTPPVFNPLVDEKSGRLQLTLNDKLMTEWVPEKHFLATIVTTIKKTFYMKSYESYPQGELVNEAARTLYNHDKGQFYEKAKVCVQQSIDEATLYSSQNSDNKDNNPSSTQSGTNSNTFVFTAMEPSHEVLRKAILGELHAHRADLLAKRKHAMSGGKPLASTNASTKDNINIAATSIDGKQMREAEVVDDFDFGAEPYTSDADTEDENHENAEAELLAQEVLHVLNLKTWKAALDGESDTKNGHIFGDAMFYDVSNEAEDFEDAQH